MKRARIVPAAFELHCPNCHEPMPSPSGSHLWELHELVAVASSGIDVHCSCGYTSAMVIPDRVKVEVTS